MDGASGSLEIYIQKIVSGLQVMVEIVTLFCDGPYWLEWLCNTLVGLKGTVY